MGGTPTQELQQKVCQKYGWSARFEAEKDEKSGGGGLKFWVCYITIGLHDTRKYVSTCPANANKKSGVAAAAQAALEGLQDELTKQEAKPQKELTDVFPLYNEDNPGDTNNNNDEEKKPQRPRFVIRGSSPRNWDNYIWSRKPSVVGIDTEGNQSTPPILVQIATDECVILEIPSMNTGGENKKSKNTEPSPPPKISDNLQRLLQDESIIKVFCDNYSHHDKKSLGIVDVTGKVVGKESDDDVDVLVPFSTGSILDLEVLASQVLGPVQVARGLSKIVTLIMPELNDVLIGKPKSKPKRIKNIGPFAMIEQGKAPPLRSLRDLSKKVQYYAALDAWVTLQAYHHIQNELESD